MTIFWKRYFLAGFFVSFCLVSSSRAAGWRFDGTGRFPNADPPVSWSKDQNVSWKVELPGRSLASPVVVGEYVFVTSDPAELICLSVKDGQVVWRRSHEYADVFGDEKGRMIEADLTAAEDIRKQKEELDRTREEAKTAGETDKQELLQEKMASLQKRYDELTFYPPKPGGDTGNSTSTPVTDGRNIFAVFGTGIVASHSLDGTRNWITFIEGARGDHSASPVLVEGRLIVHVRDLVALNPENGDVIWRVKADEQHGTPVATQVGRDFVLVTPGGDVIRASDGEIVARHQFRLGHNSPIIEDGVIYALEDGALKALHLPGTLESDIKLDAQWETTNTRANQLASPIFHDGLLYSVAETGIITVTDAKTGERVYRERLDFDGGRIDASLCLAGGYLFVSSTHGRTLVLKPGRDFQQVAKNELEGFSSSLAFAGTRIFVRAPGLLFCLAE